MEAPESGERRSEGGGIHFVVPYFVPPEYLIRLVDGVLRQSSSAWRLTIVDDAYPSNDARRYVEELGDHRIAYVRNEANLGTNRNVAKCMTLGELEFITVLGADDRPLPNYVATVLDAFDSHSDAVMVQPAVEVVGEDGRPVRTMADRAKAMASASARRRGEVTSRDAVRLLMRGNWLYLPALCIRNNAVRHARHLGQFGSIDDLAWVVDILLAGGSLVMEPTVSFQYTRRKDSHSTIGATGVTRFTEERAYFRYAAESLDAVGLRAAARMARVRPMSRAHALMAAGAALRQRNLRTAAALLAHTLT